MLDNLTHTIDEMCRELLQEYVSNLRSNGHEATGELANSATYDLNVSGNAIQITISLAEYWKYVEYGRRPGKFPPPDAILNWITTKGILPTTDSNGKLPTTQSLVFLIGRKIAEHGIEGTHDFEKAQNTILARYESRLADALTKDYDELTLQLLEQSTFLTI